MSMDRARRLEHSLPGLFEELADARTPDYLEAAIEGASSRPRRPSWTFPTRWLPMEITTTRVPASRVPWRQLGVLALIAILLAAMLAVYIGSHQQRLPPPFGVAGNGLVAYAQKGDIFTVDPVTGVSTPIVTGKPYDSDPRFSRDGTRVVFTRNEGGSIRLFASGTDGAAVTPITPGPVNLTGSRQGEPWDQYQFAPDGRSVVVASIEDGLAGISIAPSDGGTVARLDVGLQAYEPSFRPPDGREVLFVGYALGREEGAGIYAVDVASGHVRTIVEPLSEYDLAGATWSPDGKHIAYWRWGGPVPPTGINAMTRIVDADGMNDRELPVPLGTVWNTGTEWSNDGTRLFVVRGYSDAFDDVRAAIVPVDGSSAGDELEIEGTVNASCCVSFEWAPDDQKILLTPTSGVGALPQLLIDIETGEATPAPWGANSDPAWQRLAT
jgi:dipeptidyl aminopeptidase/acylaminoacyl peptidase